MLYLTCPGPFVLLIVLPLAATLTAFYVWTLNSLNFTLKDLRERKQHAKEAMYKKLWWCILLSILVIFAFFFFNSFSFASASDPDYVPFHWKSRWFVLDGWLNLVYFADVAWIAYVWRPTANNRRFAMSDEIAQVRLPFSASRATRHAIYTNMCARMMTAPLRSITWILERRTIQTMKRQMSAQSQPSTPRGEAKQVEWGITRHQARQHPQMAAASDPGRHWMERPSSPLETMTNSQTMRTTRTLDW